VKPTLDAALAIAIDHAPPELLVWRPTVVEAVRATWEVFETGAPSRETAAELFDAALAAGLSYAPELPEALVPVLRSVLQSVIGWLWRAIEGELGARISVERIEVEVVERD